ncbi:hypothetical protein VNO80_11741 [Phaseolus coccineus]|uniref:Uncharacterized protein n=1 Tax=Phaseolus coccineus TaxID=3886 RepID=A0AAN9NH25_PHACN
MTWLLPFYCICEWLLLFILSFQWIASFMILPQYQKKRIYMCVYIKHVKIVESYEKKFVEVIDTSSFMYTTHEGIK